MERQPMVGDIVVWYRNAIPSTAADKMEPCIVLWVSQDGKSVTVKGCDTNRKLAGLRHLNTLPKNPPASAIVDGAYVWPAEHQELWLREAEVRRAKVEAARKLEAQRMAEGDKRVDARRLLMSQMPIDVVVRETGLPEQVVLELAEFINVGRDRMVGAAI